MVPELKVHVKSNPKGIQTIDFADPVAVKLLNKALLKSYYQLGFWDIPDGYLCPPIPSRAEYIHQMADVLQAIVPEQKLKNIKCLDIGVGANCIYPILGFKEYKWSFVGSDIHDKTLAAAQQIVDKNPEFKKAVELRKQSNVRDIFRGIIKEGERFELSFCNPPFHESAAEAAEAARAKYTELHKNAGEKTVLNFGGKNHELWSEGGEKRFIDSIAFQSKHFKNSVMWFSTLVSKKENLKGIIKTLKKVDAAEIRTIKMDMGNKKSRLVTWTFQTPEQQVAWLSAKA